MQPKAGLVRFVVSPAGEVMPDLAGKLVLVHDDAHHAKLNAFLDWLDAPASLRRFHHAWNGLTAPETALWPDDSTLADWAACAATARQRLLAQSDLATQLIGFVTEKR